MKVLQAMRDGTGFPRKGNGNPDVHPVDAGISPFRMIILAIQNVAVMYTGAVTVPIIIGSSIGLSQEQIAVLIQSDLITCGICTIIQCVGFWRFGVRLPMMQGLTFAALSPIIVIATDPTLSAVGPTVALQVVYGAVITVGFISLVLAPIGYYVVRLFPPVVVGTVLMSVGLSLIPVGIQYASGGFVPDQGKPIYIALAFITLASIILVYMFGRGFLRNIAVLVGLAIGAIASYFMGLLDVSGAMDAAAVSFVTPFHFGLPKFHLVPILVLTLVLLITWVESIGTAFIVGDLVEKKPSGRTISDLLRADGLATIIGGVFNSFMYVAITENTTLITISNVWSRWVVAAAGVVLFLLGLSPFLAAIVASIPKPVIGAVGFVIFSSLIVFGFNAMRRINFETTFRNHFIVGISIVMCMIPLINESFFSFMPDWSQIFFNPQRLWVR